MATTMIVVNVAKKRNINMEVETRSLLFINIHTSETLNILTERKRGGKKRTLKETRKLPSGEGQVDYRDTVVSNCAALFPFHSKPQRQEQA